MKHVELTDTPNESSYLRRLLTREIERIEKWIENPTPGMKGASKARMQEDLETARLILRKLES
jgi:hypothetical protein